MSYEPGYNDCFTAFLHNVDGFCGHNEVIMKMWLRSGRMTLKHTDHRCFLLNEMRYRNKLMTHGDFFSSTSQ